MAHHRCSVAPHSSSVLVLFYLSVFCLSSCFPSLSSVVNGDAAAAAAAAISAAATDGVAVVVVVG